MVEPSSLFSSTLLDTVRQRFARTRLAPPPPEWATHVGRGTRTAGFAGRAVDAAADHHGRLPGCSLRWRNTKTLWLSTNSLRQHCRQPSRSKTRTRFRRGSSCASLTARNRPNDRDAARCHAGVPSGSSAQAWAKAPPRVAASELGRRRARLELWPRRRRATRARRARSRWPEPPGGSAARSRRARSERDPRRPARILRRG